MSMPPDCGIVPFNWHQAPREDIRRLSDRMMIDSSPEIGVA